MKAGFFVLHQRAGFLVCVLKKHDFFNVISNDRRMFGE